MQHAGKVDVVDVISLSTNKALVLDALHVAEADRITRCAQRYLFNSGHAFTSFSAGWSAAHWIAETMFLYPVQRQS